MCIRDRNKQSSDAARGSVDETKVSLSKGVGVTNKVLRGHTLQHRRCGDLEIDSIGHGYGLVCRDECPLRIRSRSRCPCDPVTNLSLIHISEPTRRTPISYAVFCLKKK